LTRKLCRLSSRSRQVDRSNSRRNQYGINTYMSRTYSRVKISPSSKESQEQIGITKRKDVKAETPIPTTRGA
jgi:hypothetical protein